MKTAPRSRGDEDVHDVYPGDHPVPHQVLRAQTVLKSSTAFIINHQTKAFLSISRATFSESRANFFVLKILLASLLLSGGDFGRRAGLVAN